MAAPADPRLRDRRVACGLTQTDLAARAGVSRQLVAAVEAGRNMPAVDAALRLAGALATSVEDLFAPAPSPVCAALGGAVARGVPLRLGRVADQLVAAELPDHGAAGAGWARPDGVLESDGIRLFPGAEPAGFVLAGCDPALGLAETMLNGLGAHRLMAISAATGTALHALGRGRVHAAVVHGVAGQLPRPPVPVARWHLARWQVGLGVAPDVGRGSLEAILSGGTPVIQRDRAAASQQAFDLAATRVDFVPPDGPVAAGHLDAARWAAMLGGAGVTNESAARAFGLRFMALETHTVEIWLAEDGLQHPGGIALGDLLANRAFTERVAQFGGYDLTDCGHSLAAA